jgi:hypothetical protein
MLVGTLILSGKLDFQEEYNATVPVRNASIEEYWGGYIAMECKH